MVSKPKLRLSFMSSTSDRVAPLLDGRVQPEGIEVIHSSGGMSEGAWRHLNFHEFELHELSISSYLISREQGADWIAIPVFPHRSFMHMNLHYNTDSGIEKPADVVGKRIGVGEYQQTAALWDARHHRQRSRRVAVQGALVHGADGGDEPRRRNGLRTAGGHLIRAHPAGREPLVHAARQQAGHRVGQPGGCRRARRARGRTSSTARGASGARAT